MARKKELNPMDHFNHLVSYYIPFSKHFFPWNRFIHELHHVLSRSDWSWIWKTIQKIKNEKHQLLFNTTTSGWNLNMFDWKGKSSCPTVSFRLLRCDPLLQTRIFLDFESKLGKITHNPWLRLPCGLQVTSRFLGGGWSTQLKHMNQNWFFSQSNSQNIYRPYHTGMQRYAISIDYFPMHMKKICLNHHEPWPSLCLWNL